jgi:hypothetical protein
MKQTEYQPYKTMKVQHKNQKNNEENKCKTQIKQKNNR